MNLIKQYLALCWFKVSPLDLPRSTLFFRLNLVFNFFIYFFIHFNMTDEIESITEVIIETLLTLGFIAFTLALHRTMYTYIQVCSAVFFCENVIAVLLIPIMFWATIAEDWLSYGVLLLILLWNWAMIAGIFKKIMNINILAGMVMSLFYILFSFGGGFAINSLISG
ncbi:hypothetical protein A1359_17365 [Methylomonas lenta]|uniref:Yip1 domain-containing protein n=2 Tax=Methylomonas lenta TaxID=980561 RepID=A0A177MWI4_9GAMM|nr:hypothetical protein A1359_17365 [Methylomonas lenta]